MPDNGSLLFVLDSRLRARKEPKKRKCRKHFDSGMAIDLQYDSGFYVSSGQAGAFSLPLSDALRGGYRVEAFEDDDQESDGELAWGTGELDDTEDGDGSSYAAGNPSGGNAALLAASLSDDTEVVVAVWGTGELEGIKEAVAASLSDEAETAIPWGTEELEAMDASPAATSLSDDLNEEPPVWGTAELEGLTGDAALPASASYISPNAAAIARKLKEQHLLQSEDPDSRAFAQDLQAILAGKKDHPSTTGNAAPQPEPDEDAAPQGDSPRAYPSNFSHGVFDQMGPNMSMAKTFDLGSYDLSRQFDVFDRQMDKHDHSSQRKRTKKAGVRAQSAEFAEDLALMSGLAPSIPTPRALDVTPTYDLRFEVPLVPQQTGFSCWAAGCAMLVGWRDQISIDPSEIANATGAWAAYKNGLNPEEVSIFPVWGMSPEAAQSYTVQAFYNLLDAYGPLWVASAVPSSHIRVVTGITGDGTPDGTTLIVNDPLETGMTTFRLPNAGAQYTETYAQFVSKQETLARRESTIAGAVYVAHLSGHRKR
jgi:hypothetical protein